MNTREPAAHASAAAEPAAAPGRAPVTPAFPLLLLQTMRDMDRPAEVLEDEDLSVSMPRRFGLSDVVGRQIHRFEEEVRRRRPQSAGEVENLVRLVMRRPDAEAIFREAGRRVARRAWEERAGALRRGVRWLPRTLALATALRAARRLFRSLTGGAGLRLQKRPLELRVVGSLTARADPGGRACSFYTGALEELLTRYTGRSYRALHPHCEAHGAVACVWTVRVA